MSLTLEKAFVVVLLLYFAGALNMFLDPGGQAPQDAPSTPIQAMMQQRDRHKNADPTEKNPTKLVAQVAIYLLAATLIWRRREEYLELALRHKLLWALLALAMLSALWSEVPGFTLRRSLVVLASTSIGVYLGVRYTMREIIRLICIAGGIAAMASLVVIVLRPDIGISSGATDGAWQGIFGQKNTLGEVMSLTTLAFAMAYFQEKRRGFMVGAVACFALLILSRDASATLMTPLLVALVPIYNYGRKRSMSAAPLLFPLVGVVVAAVLFSVLGNAGQALQLMNKDTSLSGRTEIWSLVWQKFMASPWVGYGYSAFWLGAEGTQSADIWAAVHWPVPHSHNGFFDILADLGLAGFCLFFAGFISCWRQAVRCARLSKSWLGVFPLVYLTLMILFNLSEGSILRQESIFWVLYATTWVLTTRWLKLATSPTSQLTQTQFARVEAQPSVVSA